MQTELIICKECKGIIEDLSYEDGTFCSKACMTLSWQRKRGVSINIGLTSDSRPISILQPILDNIKKEELINNGEQKNNRTGVLQKVSV